MAWTCQHAHSDRFCFPGLRDVCLLIKNALNWRRDILHGSPSHPRQKCWSSSMVHRPKVKKTTTIQKDGHFKTCLKPLQPNWWYTYPSEKYESQLGWLIIIPNIWKNKIHVPNHQPANQLNAAAKVSGLFKSAAAFSKQSTTSCQVLLVFRDAMSCFYQTERPNAKQ